MLHLVRFYNAVDLSNALIAEQAEGNTGNIIRQLTALDCVIIDELGYIPFPKSGGSLLFHLISKLYETTDRATRGLEILLRAGHASWHSHLM